MPLSKHFGGKGSEVMSSMMKTYKSPKKAKEVFYATENKRKGLKEQTADLARKGKLRMK